MGAGNQMGKIVESSKEDMHVYLQIRYTDIQYTDKRAPTIWVLPIGVWGTFFLAKLKASGFIAQSPVS
jgi:hypothetical protein